MSAISYRSLTSPGIAAVRRYWRPFLLLQSAAVALVAAYYASETVRQFCVHLTAFKAHAGVVFSVIGAAVAGAILPELAKTFFHDPTAPARQWDNIVFAAAVFGFNGIIVEFQYALLARIFGNDTHFSTAIKKSLADQFVTTPLWGLTYFIVLYTFREQRYHPVNTLRQLTPAWYGRRVLPLLLPNWAYWLPMSLLIYLLPGPLQFLLYCFAVAAWSLVMVFVATRESVVETQL